MYPTNLINSYTIDSLLTTHHPYLATGDTIYLHVPFKVTSCDTGVGHFEFYTLCNLDTSARCNKLIYPTHVSVEPSITSPQLTISVDTLDNATYCPRAGKDSMRVKFIFTNNGTYSSDSICSGRADSLRIHLFCNTNAGHINPSTIRINNVLIDRTLYISTSFNPPYTVNNIDLTGYPAGITGQPFGPNTIQDLDGNGNADAIAEGNTFLCYGNICL